jgi:hypothetical protein
VNVRGSIGQGNEIHYDDVDSDDNDDDIAYSDEEEVDKDRGWCFLMRFLNRVCSCREMGENELLCWLVERMNE